MEESEEQPAQREQNKEKRGAVNISLWVQSTFCDGTKEFMWGSG